MIKDKSLAIGLFFAALAASPSVNAYELATHARMTQAAISRSVLYDGQNPNSQFFKSLGLDSVVLTQSGSFAANPFGDSYYDASGNTVNTRTVNAFEARFMPVADTELLTLPAWFLRGAIREDDYAHAFGIWVAPNPQDDTDQPQAFWRMMNHFYDPVNNRALTGKNKNNEDVAPTKDDRNKYWATLFRALGDIVHLVQDMAQPQHTRNDQHAGKFPEFLTGHKSVYEAYMDCRATGGQVEYIDNYQDHYLDSCYSLTYTGHPTPVFTKYSDYFATRDGTGRGLAEYSNRNFFTAGTNLIRSHT